MTNITLDTDSMFDIKVKKWIDKNSGQVGYGLSAQDAHEKFPELVVYIDQANITPQMITDTSGEILLQVDNEIGKAPLGVSRKKQIAFMWDRLSRAKELLSVAKTAIIEIKADIVNIKAQGSALLNLATGNQNRIDALETDNATANKKLRNIENRLIALEADNVTAWSAIRNL